MLLLLSLLVLLVFTIINIIRIDDEQNTQTYYFERIFFSFMTTKKQD